MEQLGHEQAFQYRIDHPKEWLHLLCHTASLGLHFWRPSYQIKLNLFFSVLFHRHLAMKLGMSKKRNFSPPMRFAQGSLTLCNLSPLLHCSLLREAPLPTWSLRATLGSADRDTSQTRTWVCASSLLIPALTVTSTPGPALRIRLHQLTGRILIEFWMKISKNQLNDST